ncbi:MAG: carbamoyltransferase HypF, partial [Chloroflexota bacterium]
DNFAFVSQHIGDMENLETLEHFTNTIGLYKRLFRIEPEIIACDMHPEYLPTKYAKELAEREGIKLFPVQHHHAHIVACLADNDVKGPVIGVSFDGTGYGPDGRIWGGEFMVADYKEFTRTAHLEYLPLPGGALAIRKPYRTAAGYLAALGIDFDPELPLFQYIDDVELKVIKGQIENNINAPLTSSLGRLFDAVAALTGVRGVIDYEAQAAIDLETVAADAAGEDGYYSFATAERDGLNIIGVRDLFVAIIKDLRVSTPTPVIAARFHNSVAQMITETCRKISAGSGLDRVALSGGVFQNRRLLRKAVAMLESAGLRVYTHRQVPCNDGGISLGQAVIAHFNNRLE